MADWHLQLTADSCNNSSKDDWVSGQETDRHGWNSTKFISHMPDMLCILYTIIYDYCKQGLGNGPKYVFYPSMLIPPKLWYNQIKPIQGIPTANTIKNTGHWAPELLRKAGLPMATWSLFKNTIKADKWQGLVFGGYSSFSQILK